MGYYSNYSIRLAGSTSDERKKVVEEIESVSGYKFENKTDERCETEDHTWYDYRKHLAKIAKKHPDVYIEVIRTGEDRDDQEISRFHAGETESVTADIVFPSFTHIFFPSEDNDSAAGDKTAFVGFTEEELILLRDVIHDYKDAHRGMKEFLVPVMELEKKFAALSGGRYEPDTTYDWNESPADKNEPDDYTFVDLGLPSGKLWASENVKDKNGNEAYFTFYKAKKTFGNNLPSNEDWEELFDNSKCEWNRKRKGYDVTGPNGNTIFLPAAGYRCGVSMYCVGSFGYYWSSSRYIGYVAYDVTFDSGHLSYQRYSDCYNRLSVRLCK